MIKGTQYRGWVAMKIFTSSVCHSIDPGVADITVRIWPSERELEGYYAWCDENVGEHRKAWYHDGGLELFFKDEADALAFKIRFGTNG